MASRPTYFRNAFLLTASQHDASIYRQSKFVRPRVVRLFVSSLSVVLTALTALLLVALTSALPPVLDIRPALFVASVLASVLVFAVSRKSSSVVRRALTLALAVALGSVALATVYDLTLAYRTEEVSFTNGDVTLRGTLYLPRERGRHPALVFIHGSGVQPRDESRFYARTYAREGIAGLAYDKRGSGESSGSVQGVTYQALADDAFHGIELLRRHSEVNAQQVGVHGISEGEWTGVLAALKARPAFLVIVSGAAMSPAEQVAYETAENVRRGGFGEDAAQQAGDLYRRVSAFYRTGQGRDALNRALDAASEQPWFDTAWYLEKSVPDYSELQQVPWFNGWLARMDFDALPLMGGLTCPVLLQEGGADPKMDGAAAIKRMRQAVERGGKSRFTGILYPDASHNIIEWRLPWHMPPPWFASGYLTDQTHWVADQVGFVDR